MKKIYILLLSLFTITQASVTAIGVFVTEIEAVQYIQEMYGYTTMDIYSGEYSANEWLVFVDLEPQKGWEHDCVYFYVSKLKPLDGSPRVRSATRKFPPSGIELTPRKINNRVTRAPLNIKVPKTSSNATNTHTYAVILSGGGNQTSNYERYWNDCSFIYQTLINKYLIPKQNTYVVMADGTDPAEDMNCGGYYKSSPLDLDFDGSPDLGYAATKVNITNIFNELSRKLTKNDHLFFFVIDHGGTHDYTTQSYINLWGSEVLEDYELSGMLDKINAGSMNIVLGQCFSGGFVDNIAKSGRVISTACTGSQYSYSCSNIPYDEFVHQWTSAVAGQTAYGESVVSDSDESGHVTMDEAYNYAETNDRASETPMYNSTPLSVGEDLAFDKSPNLVDLYIRDNIEDTGKEPNTTTDISWNSPDVWVRNQRDGILEHENPYYSDEHPATFINVRITNRGSRDYNGQGQYLHLYWAKASTGLSMNAWRGKELYKNAVTGEAMRAVHIDRVISAGNSETFTVVWALPYDLLGPESDNDTENHHFCLFARISEDFADTDEEDLITKYNTANILGSNKLTQKNLSIIQKNSSNDLLSTVFVRNTMGSTRNYTLEIRPHTAVDRDLFTAARVEMKMSPPILTAWQRGGSRCSQVAYSASNPSLLQLQSSDSKLYSINLAKNEFEKISLSCTFNSLFVSGSKKYAFDLIQRDETTGEIIGGESFIVSTPTLSPWGPIVIRPSIIDNRYVLKAETETPNEISNFKWTDKTGHIIGNSDEITVTPTLRNNEYTVTAARSGVFEQASITLDQIQGIESVSPSPATNYIDVTLKTPVDNDATYIKVQSVLNNMVVKKEVVKSSSQARIELGNIPKGVVVIQLISHDEVIDNTKVIRN